MITFTINSRLRVAACILVMLIAASAAVMAASGADIDAHVDKTLAKFEKDVKGANRVLQQAKGVLVFTGVIKAGLGIGGEHGNGALRIDGKTVDYYSISSGSIGLQIGVQKKDIIMVFRETGALEKFRASSGWKLGAEAEVVVVDVGADGQIDTNRLKGPVVAFVVGQEGLMGGVSLSGSKISKIKVKN